MQLLRVVFFIVLLPFGLARHAYRRLFCRRQDELRTRQQIRRQLRYSGQSLAKQVARRRKRAERRALGSKLSKRAWSPLRRVS